VLVRLTKPESRLFRGSALESLDIQSATRTRSALIGSLIVSPEYALINQVGYILREAVYALSASRRRDPLSASASGRQIEAGS
jgi:hypothetical protein